MKMRGLSRPVPRSLLLPSLLLSLGACDSSETLDPTAGFSESWPSYGRDHDNSRANLAETAINTSTVAQLETSWTVELPGCTSTPTVLEGIVYVGDWDGNVSAIEAASGGTLWTNAISMSQVDPSVLATDDQLFVGDGAGAFYALDRASGDTQWTVQLDDHESTHIYGSAAYVDGLVLIGVASIELVAIKDDYDFRGSLVALDAATGDEVWRVYMTDDDAMGGAGVSVWSSPAIDVERQWVFIGTGQTYEAPASLRADAIVAVDYTSGDVKWVRQFTMDDVYTIFQEAPQGPDADVGAAPNLFSVSDTDYVGVGDKAGVYSVLNRDTGETVWAKAVTPGSMLGGVMNSAAVADGVIYVTSNEFASESLATVLDSPVPEDTHTTVAYDAATGDEVWRTTQPFPSVGGLTFAGGVVYHGSVDGTIHALDASNGEELWSNQVGTGLASGSSIVDGRLFVSHGFRFFTGSGDLVGGVTAFEL